MHLLSLAVEHYRRATDEPSRPAGLGNLVVLRGSGHPEQGPGLPAPWPGQLAPVSCTWPVMRPVFVDTTNWPPSLMSAAMPPSLVPGWIRLPSPSVR